MPRPLGVLAIALLVAACAPTGPSASVTAAAASAAPTVAAVVITMPPDDIPADVAAKLTAEKISFRNLTSQERAAFAALDVPTVARQAATALVTIPAPPVATYTIALRFHDTKIVNGTRYTTDSGWVPAVGLRYEGVVGHYEGHDFTTTVVWLQLSDMALLFMQALVEVSPAPTT